MAKDNLECTDAHYRIDVSIEEMRSAQKLLNGDGGPGGALAYAAAMQLVQREVGRWPKQLAGNLIREVLLNVADLEIVRGEWVCQSDDADGAPDLSFSFD